MHRGPRFIFSVLASLVLAAAALAAEVRIATQNCFLLFDPAIDHRGKVDDEQRMTSSQYATKLGNLASMLKGFDVVAIQETGGQAEISALAARSGLSWLWTKGGTPRPARKSACSTSYRAGPLFRAVALLNSMPRSVSISL